MRDYAELGRQAGQRGRARSRRHGDVGLGRVWGVIASPFATLALELLLAILLILESAGPGATLPSEDPGRFGPMGLRVLLALLATNLLASSLERLWPLLKPRVVRRRRGSVLGEGTLQWSAPLPEMENNPRLSAWLTEMGAKAAGEPAPRRGLGSSGRAGPIGVILLHVAGLVMLTGYALGIDDAVPGWITLRGDVEAEALQHTSGLSTSVALSTPTQGFSGYRFTLRNAEALKPLLSMGTKPNPELGKASVEVFDLQREKVEPEDPKGRQANPINIPVDRRGRVRLPDGSSLRVVSLREVAQPSAAVVRVTELGGDVRIERYPKGQSLVLKGGVFLTVMDITRDRLGFLGPAVQLKTDEGEPFWVYQHAPGLVDLERPDIAANFEVLETQPSIEATFEHNRPSEGLLAPMGIVLMLIGGVFLLIQEHTSVELIDEVDRLVIQGTSFNDMSGLPARMQMLASASTEIAITGEAGAETLAEALETFSATPGSAWSDEGERWGWSTQGLARGADEAALSLSWADVERVALRRVGGSCRAQIERKNDAPGWSVRCELLDPRLLKDLPAQVGGRDDATLPLLQWCQLIATARETGITLDSTSPSAEEV